VGLIITFWGSLSYLGINSEKLNKLKFPWEPMMIGVIATVSVVISGWCFSFIFPAEQENISKKTLRDFWREGFRLKA